MLHPSQHAHAVLLSISPLRQHLKSIRQHILSMNDPHGISMQVHIAVASNQNCPTVLCPGQVKPIHSVVCMVCVETKPSKGAGWLRPTAQNITRRGLERKQ